MTAGGVGDVEALAAAARLVQTWRDDGQPVVWRIWQTQTARADVPVMLLLHGSFGSWTHWARNIQALAAVATVVAVDMPGFGDSGLAPPECWPEEMGCELAEAWARLCGQMPELVSEGRPLIIAGFSLGAIYAGWMARVLKLAAERRPAQRLEAEGGQAAGVGGLPAAPLGLVLVAPGGLGARPGLNFPLQSVPRGEAPEAARLAAHRHNLGVIMFADPSRIDAAAVCIQNANVERTSFRGPYTRQSGSLLEALQGLGIPVLGLWGDGDAFDEDVRLRVEAVRAVVQQSEVVVLEGVGHWLIYEAAAPANRLMCQWLRRIVP